MGKLFFTITPQVDLYGPITPIEFVPWASCRILAYSCGLVLRLTHWHLELPAARANKKIKKYV
jgi:hypothetical protein